jgi:hypothetical protein
VSKRGAGQFRAAAARRGTAAGQDPFAAAKNHDVAGAPGRTEADGEDGLHRPSTSLRARALPLEVPIDAGLHEPPPKPAEGVGDVAAAWCNMRHPQNRSRI